ncbi:DUF2306 domain-containing protein [Sandarakinorhabdus oryzae]|uniref:DUF2306 domain-containing protein n=1 Tax=Sandarakinorhabdus oryzae TaxID=2675220 RepID=UPI0018CC5AAF|nr:DUF2306 domain-containing protein [Sandarakinorhabdus oryzae]
MATKTGAAQSMQTLRQPWLWFAAALLLTGIGFWPSFLSHISAAPPHILVHGLSATLWMALPVVQAVLIRRRQRGVHRQLGYASLALAAVVAISGLRVVQTMVLTSNPGITLTTYKFVLLDLTGIALFVAFVGLAIRAARRRDIPLHLRLMASSAIIPLEAANERTAILLGLAPDFSAALYVSLVSIELICVGLILAEWRFSRLRWPVPALLGYYLVMHAIATPVAMNPGFQAFAQAYARIGG